MDGRPPACSPARSASTWTASSGRPSSRPRRSGSGAACRKTSTWCSPGAVNGTEEAVYRFNINPLVWWVWFGGFVLAFGGIVTMWPGGGPRGAVAPGAGRLWGLARRGRGRSERHVRRPTRFPSPRIGACCRSAPGPMAARRCQSGRGRAPGLAGRPRRDRDAARPRRGGAPPGAHGRRGECRGDPGDRASAGLQLRLHARRLHLPNHRLLLHLLSRLHREVLALRSRGNDGPAGAGCVRRQVRREGADGSEAARLQSGRLPGSRRGHHGRRRGAGVPDPAAAGGGGRGTGGRRCQPLEASPEEMERLRRALADVED